MSKDMQLGYVGMGGCWDNRDQGAEEKIYRE